MSTIAGDGTSGSSGNGGPATSAQLTHPAGVSVDAAGNVYIADAGANVIRKVATNGTITTVAGTGAAGSKGDGGPATSALLNSPTDVVMTPAGTLYIADSGNHEVREVLPDGTIVRAAGTGVAGYNGDNKVGSRSKLDSPEGLDVDSSGNVYIADAGNDDVRMLTPAGRLTTVAGDQTAGYTGDGGPATAAALNNPVDVAAYAGKLYIADANNRVVRMVSPAGTISTVAGNGLFGNAGDGGPAMAARLAYPTGLAVDSSGNLFISDFWANDIRKVDTGGTITTVAGTGAPGYTGDGGDATMATLNGPSRVNLDAAGDLFISDWSNHVVREAALLGTAATAPDAPTGVTATAGFGQIDVTWTAPANDGGSPVTGFNVTVDDGSSPITVPVDPAQSETIVTGLQNGVSYTITVTATNSVGTSVASLSTSATPSAAPVIPDSPTGVAATAGDSQISVSWSVPVSDGGSPITGYTVTVDDGVSPQTVPVAAGATATTVGGLVNGTIYAVTVSATNAVGTSAESSPPAIVTPMTVPGAPTGVSVTAGDGQLAVSWTAPVSDGGSAISDYTVTVTDGTIPQAVSVAAGSTSTTVSGLTNGVAYTVTVSATNSAGTSPDSATTSATPVTVPGAPTGVTATSGDGQIDVLWTAPASDGGSTITGYTVTADDGVSPQSVTAAAGATGATVTGLTNGNSYSITVSATNAVGTSALASAPASVTPMAVATVPDAPTGVTVTPDDGQLAVSWTAPASDGGSVLTGYTVTVTDGTTPQTVPVAVGSTSTTVSGLTNGVAYTVTVSAANAVGSSPDSAPASATPVAAATVPGAPTGVTATPGDGQLGVSWTAPANDGGSAITGYTVTVTDGTTPQTASVPYGTTSKTVTGLTNGTSYTVTVSATNAVGSSPDSAPSSATPVAAATVPGAPTGVTATPGDGRLGVSWTAPANDGGSAITGYTVTVDDGGTTTVVSVGSGITSVTINGLTNGNSYTVSVTASNAVGSSTPDALAGSVSPQAPAPAGGGGGASTTTVPDTPFNVVVHGDDGAIRVSWTPPADDGGSAITGYSVTVDDGSGPPETVVVGPDATSVTVSGLTNGTEYEVSVTASNAVGSSTPSDPLAVTPKQPAGSGGGNTGNSGGSHNGGGTGGSTPTTSDQNNGQPAAPTMPAVPVPGPQFVAPQAPTVVLQHPRHHHHLAATRATQHAPAVGPDPTVKDSHPPVVKPVHHQSFFTSVTKTLAAVSKNGAVPGVLIGIILLFLVVQNQLDRRDPKLALAPVYADPGVSFVPAMS